MARTGNVVETFGLPNGTQNKTVERGNPEDLQSLHMTLAVIRRLDTFHLRGFRQILKITTTLVDRPHANAYVHEVANRSVATRPHRTTEEEGGGAVQNPSITPLSAHHERRRIALLGHILRTGEADPMRESTLRETAAPALLPQKDLAAKNKNEQ